MVTTKQFRVVRNDGYDKTIHVVRNDGYDKTIPCGT